MTESDFTVAIIGLGLMGGSLAYALRGFRNGRVIGFDIQPETTKQALQRGAIDQAAVTLEEAVATADLALFCSSPASIMDNMQTCFDFMKQGAVVSDICGIKKDILDFLAANLPSGIDYVGLHPMAGKEVGGFDNADKLLFRNAGFILVLPDGYRQESVTLLEELSAYVGAGRVVINRANEHDELIAYTSDLMHISAAALCVDYPKNMTMAHTAGAFRDCTRIARIDADLWTELLHGNAENIVTVLERYIENLTALKNALADGDKPFTHAFLQKACENKETMQTL